jgi:hypothetical protein
MYFIPTSGSWLNLVERWFCDLTAASWRGLSQSAGTDRSD